MIVITTGSTVYVRKTEEEAQKIVALFERCHMSFVKEVF